MPIQEASDAVGDLVEVAEQMAIDGAVVLSHKGVIVRKTASKRSGVVTRAAEGEEIEIPQPIKLERTESGTTRLQIDQGWATLETKQGNRLLGTRKSIWSGSALVASTRMRNGKGVLWMRKGGGTKKFG